MDDYTALLRYLDIQAEKYHEYGCSDISDSIYDSLARRVGRTTVGAKSTVGEELVHPVPMLSLDNILTEGGSDSASWTYDNYYKWKSSLLRQYPEIGDCLWVIEPKLDGVALRVNYTDGELTSAALRGDRYRGRDVTECIRLSGIVPVRLSESLTIEVRGEINCAEGVFNAYNTLIQSSGDKGYTTARNAVAGWLLSGNVGLIGTLTQLTVYDVIGLGDTHTENISKLKALGFTAARLFGVFSSAYLAARASPLAHLVSNPRAKSTMRF